jgi:glyoxylase-like metal-dependent hydrolase (beta-lactamase superfamily II)
MLLTPISPVIRRVVAPNPGPMTGTGTNTYILGFGRVAVIDPGPLQDAHLTAVLNALKPSEIVTHILVTHTHLDHSALAPRLAHLTGALTAGFGPYRTPPFALPHGGEGIDHHFMPGLCLPDGASLSDDTWHIQALHTPGHAANHLCFAWGDLLFSGDHVMGWSTSLISPPDGDMAAYMASLFRLQAHPWAKALPGHGAPVTDVPARLDALIAHRRAREAAILAVLTAQPCLLSALTEQVYMTTPAALRPAARRNVLAHALDLAARNEITLENPAAPDPLLRRT